jgi:restriction endonuclease S subunit
MSRFVISKKHNHKEDTQMSKRKKPLDQRIAANLQKRTQLQAEHDALMVEQKEAERKARDQRLFKRGGIVEKHLPDLIGLTDKQFDVFIEKVLLTPHTSRIIASLKAENEPPKEPPPQEPTTEPKTTTQEPKGES